MPVHCIFLLLSQAATHLPLTAWRKYCPCTVLYLTVLYCTADRNEHRICSTCCNQQALYNHKMVTQIICCMWVPYKTLMCRLLADGFNCQVHLVPAGVFSSLAWAFKFPKFCVLEINRINCSWSKQKLCFKNKFIYMHTNVWSFSFHPSSCHHVFTHCLLFFYSCILPWEKLLCCVRNVPENFDNIRTFEPYGSEFMTFLLHCELRKQQFWPSPVPWRQFS